MRGLDVLAKYDELFETSLLWALEGMAWVQPELAELGKYVKVLVEIKELLIKNSLPRAEDRARFLLSFMEGLSAIRPHYLTRRVRDLYNDIVEAEKNQREGLSSD